MPRTKTWREQGGEGLWTGEMHGFVTIAERKIEMRVFVKRNEYAISGEKCFLLRCSEVRTAKLADMLRMR
jgi:hypothetical protein